MVYVIRIWKELELKSVMETARAATVLALAVQGGEGLMNLHEFSEMATEPLGGSC